jgi:predicted CoA-substrate-specific enzyme activase
MDDMTTNNYYIGIDVGSVSLNSIVITQDKKIVYEAPYKRHMGKMEESVSALISKLHNKFGKDSIKALAFTGNHGKAFSSIFEALYEFDTISQVTGAVFLRPDVRTIITMGGQDTGLFKVRRKDNDWDLESFNSNGPCASGTGSFIDQQAMRLATSIYDNRIDASQQHIDKILSDFIDLGLKSENPANVACRCTVFTKSDMIHLQNKGERLEDIIYGLHLGNARNYMSTIVSNQSLDNPILFIGGLSMNRLQVLALQTYFPNMVVPPYSTSVGALGVALQALESNTQNSINPEVQDIITGKQFHDLAYAPKLDLKKTFFHENAPVRYSISGAEVPVYLGIDIGSTTTKYSLINKERKIIHKDYVHTQGKPIEVTRNLLKNIDNEVGRHIRIMGVATTGSGRNVVGDFLNADLILDEITAHARGAVEIDPSIDTIFEIGGQDAKYISISNTYPLDFDMNKVCAAGTGSFLHELANKYGINIVGEFQKIALSSDTPIKLAERCTVFMESDLVSYHQRGASIKDLMAGLCYAVVHNYLNRVVGKRKIGDRVMFLGGPSLNKGVVAAFENILGQGLIVPEHREVLGAFGAAISVLDKMTMEGSNVSSFRGLESAAKDCMKYTEKTCSADENCHNQCKLKIYNFDGRKSVWGGECGRYDVARGMGPHKKNFFELRDKIWQSSISGLHEVLGDEPIFEIDGRPTIGMQRSLYAIQTIVLWANFFDRLGFRLVLTPPTNNLISGMGIEAMTAETCYPVKVSHGHVKYLAGKTSRLFLPVIVDMPTPKRREKGFYCPLVQANSYMTRAALDLKNDSIIAPVIHLKRDRAALSAELAGQLSRPLGISGQDIKQALDHAVKRQDEFANEMYKMGAEILASHDPATPLLVVTGRPYNLYDERLNLRLGQNLAKIGISAIPMDFIDLSTVDISDFPNMYWGLGAQILRAAKFIKARQGYYGLHLTNFSCGADSFIEHFYKHVMGNKPYLILELDEHSAVAGVMTRLEAYENVIRNNMQGMNNNFCEEIRAANYGNR